MASDIGREGTASVLEFSRRGDMKSTAPAAAVDAAAVAAEDTLAGAIVVVVV